MVGWCANQCHIAADAFCDYPINTRQCQHLKPHPKEMFENQVKEVSSIIQNKRTFLRCDAARPWLKAVCFAEVLLNGERFARRTRVQVTFLTIFLASWSSLAILLVNILIVTTFCPSQLYHPTFAFVWVSGSTKKSNLSQHSCLNLNYVLATILGQFKCNLTAEISIV